MTSASSCTGPGSGGASTTSVPPFMSLSGLNGGTASAKPVGVNVRVVCEASKRPRLHHFLVSDLDAGRNLERLLIRDDVDRPKQPIALAGIDALFLRVGGAPGGREFRRLGKVILAVEIEIERRADQGRAAETGQDAPASHRSDALRRSLRSSRSSPNRIGGSTPRSEPTVARSPREPRRGKAAANVVKTVVSLAVDARVAIERAARLVNAHARRAQV